MAPVTSPSPDPECLRPTDGAIRNSCLCTYGELLRVAPIEIYSTGIGVGDLKTRGIKPIAPVMRSPARYDCCAIANLVLHIIRHRPIPSVVHE